MTTFDTSAAGQGATDTGATGSGAAAATQVQDGGGSAAGAQGTTPPTDEAAGTASAQGAGGDAAGQAQQQGQQGAESGQQAHWSEAMPEDWRETLSAFESADAARDALKRGNDYKPVSTPEDVGLAYPDGMNVDQAQADRFRSLAVEIGLTPEQGQRLLDWQLKEGADAYAAMKASAEKTLRDQWGANYERNGKQALTALTALDRRMGGRLAPEFELSGGADNPVLIEALYTIGTLIGEDTLSGASASASGSNKEISTEDYMKEVFENKE